MVICSKVVQQIFATGHDIVECSIFKWIECSIKVDFHNLRGLLTAQTLQSAGSSETGDDSAELVCLWARVESSLEGRRSLGQRSKAFGVFLPSNQSQNSADPTQGVKVWLDSRVQLATGWWPIKSCVFWCNHFFARTYHLQMFNHVF